MPSVHLAARSVPSRVPNMLRLLPCQRPASPEMKLSPSETIAVGPDVGLACVEDGRLTSANNASMAPINSTNGSRAGTPKVLDMVLDPPY